MNPIKEARRDAHEYARAQMFYGEGAGNRRKIIEATVEAKRKKNPTYARAFRHELSLQDMAEHAIKARHERERKDAAKALNANARGIITGNYQSVNTLVLVAFGLGFVAHKTGLDVKAVEISKKKWREFKARREANKPDPTTPHPRVRHVKFN